MPPQQNESPSGVLENAAIPPKPAWLKGGNKSAEAKPADVPIVPLEEEELRGKPGSPHWPQTIAVYFFSMVLHAGILAIMAMIILPADVREEILSVLVDDEQMIDNAPMDEPVEEPQLLDEVEFETEPTNVEALVQKEEADSQFKLDINDLDVALNPEALEGPSLPIDNIKSLSAGRSEAARKSMLKERGGTEASDAAVGLALEWLASIQRSDGSWDYNDVGQSSGKGSLSCPTGATALALMAFLGAGHTHDKAGKHQDTVKRGLNFLMESAIRKSEGLDLRGKSPGNEGMYVQAIAAIALAEAYGMTNDRRLLPFVAGATDFIIRAQHGEGGWRYRPNQAGDTSVVGWQVMALKSARSANIPIPRRVSSGINKFLNAASHDRGSKYSYMPGQGPKPSTTSIGLLCRMYMGWKADNPALINGVKYLAQVGPSKTDIYYDYYASQVMIQFTGARGEVWDKWNTALRDWLVDTQKKSGPEKGSWDVIESGHKGQRGGRLYTTCMAVMTLEIYYRVLPLYQHTAVEAEL